MSEECCRWNSFVFGLLVPMRRWAFTVFPYINLCKMKRTLVVTIVGGFYFLCAKYTNHVPRMLYIKYQSIWNANSWEHFLKFTKFEPFWGLNKCQPLDFCKLESPFPTNGWNQFSGFGEVVQRKSLRTTVADTYSSSLEYCAQVS